MIHSKLNIIQLRIILICGKGVGMIRVDFGPISETVCDLNLFYCS